MLILDPENEHLRDTLFWHMYHNTILIDDLPRALEYATSSSMRNQTRPSMFTMTRERMQSDGILDPVSAPKDLRNVYGAQTPTNTDEYRNLVMG